MPQQEKSLKFLLKSGELVKSLTKEDKLKKGL
jgi:hypothetical protein